MRLQQLRYLIAVAEKGSMNSAASALFVSQSSLSVAVKELEDEMGVQIFNRTSRGITLTSDGVELLGYARQVVEQADLMIERYSGADGQTHGRLSISSQHYAFAVNAFIDFVREQEGPSYNYVLRETRTAEIIDDVRTFRSDLGILFLSNFNERVLRRRFDEGELVFTSLFKARPHVFVRQGHPLAQKGRVRVDDLAPYPRYTFEQGAESSLFYSEEPLASLPHSKQIVASDRGTLTGLLANYDGFLVSTGVRSDEMYSGIVSLPIECDEVMNVGYVIHRERRLSPLAQRYVDKLCEKILSVGDVIQPSKAVLAAVRGE